MTDIDVEPVTDVDEEESRDDAVDEQREDDTDDHQDDIEPSIDDIDLEDVDAPVIDRETPEYVLYGGKGGVGKTTMAAATGLSSARAGDRTLVVSTDPAHSLSDTYETTIGSRPERIREEIPLYAAEIDPEEAMQEGLSLFGGGGPTEEAPFAADDAFDDEDPFADAETPFQGGDGAGGPLGGMMGGELSELLGGESPMEALMGGAMPGADEAAAMQLLLEFLDDERFDRVIVDTAPTGHTLRLLQLPEVMDTMVGRMMRVRERLSGLFDGIKGMIGGGETPPEQGVDDLEELQERIERLRVTLTDPALTDFRIVMVPEEMSVMESERLHRQLQEFDIPVETVVVNKVMEPLTDVTDDVDSGEFVSPNLEECGFCQRRWDVQQDALARAQELFRGHTIRRVPLLAEEVRGDRALRVVAACLSS
jgi:arsenite-transporting ATPase